MHCLNLGQTPADILILLLFGNILPQKTNHVSWFGALKGRSLRDGFKKSKWKFKMAFAMKGGGLECHIPILKNDFC